MSARETVAARIERARALVAAGRLLVPPPDFATDAGRLAYGDALDEASASHGELGGPLHVYAHVPLCDERCSFCMYYYSPNGRSTDRSKRCAGQLQRLLGREAAPVPADALYVGGGTPSVLSEEHLAAVLDALTHRHPPTTLAQFTVEMSPRSATKAKISIAIERGANRLSFGLQTFDATVLARARRQPASPEHLGALVEAGLAAGVHDVNVDLMHGLAGQAPGDLARNVAVLASIGTPTITMYRRRPLGPEPVTPDHVGTQTLEVEQAVASAGELGYVCDGNHAAECVRLFRTQHHRGGQRLPARNGYRTQADPVLGNHLLGYGSGAQTLAGGALRFTCGHVDDFDDDLADRVVTAWRTPISDQYRIAVVRALYWHRQVDDLSLAGRFSDSSLEATLGPELDELERLGAIRRSAELVEVVASADDWVVLEKALYPDEWLGAVTVT